MQNSIKLKQVSNVRHWTSHPYDVRHFILYCIFIFSMHTHVLTLTAALDQLRVLVSSTIYGQG